MLAVSELYDAILQATCQFLFIVDILLHKFLALFNFFLATASVQTSFALGVQLVTQLQDSLETLD